MVGSEALTRRTLSNNRIERRMCRIHNLSPAGRELRGSDSAAESSGEVCKFDCVVTTTTAIYIRRYRCMRSILANVRGRSVGLRQADDVM